MRVANKVAINTVIQYTRLLLNFVISLYSVRVILNALGASDYGIYDVIAGVIAILGFLNSLNSSYKCNGIHINNLFKFFVWCEVSKSFTRSII